MLLFAEPQSTFYGVSLFLVIWTVFACVCYAILTRDDAVRPEFRDGFGKSMLRVSPRSAFLLVLPVWLVACIWIYQTQLVGKFYGLERVGSTRDIVWEFHYYHPLQFWSRYPVVRIPDKNIATWSVIDDWGGKSLTTALVAEDRDGNVYRSFGANRWRFRKEYRQRLQEWGVKIH